MKSSSTKSWNLLILWFSFYKVEGMGLGQGMIGRPSIFSCHRNPDWQLWRSDSTVSQCLGPPASLSGVQYKSSEHLQEPKSCENCVDVYQAIDRALADNWEPCALCVFRNSNGLYFALPPSSSALCVIPTEWPGWKVILCVHCSKIGRRRRPGRRTSSLKWQECSSLT